MHPSEQSACRHTEHSPTVTEPTSGNAYSHVLGVKGSRVHPAVPTQLRGLIRSLVGNRLLIETRGATPPRPPVNGCRCP